MAKPRILIVEDEQMSLSVCGAVSAIEAARVDAMLSDIDLLANDDGLRAARLIRQRYDVPVVFIIADAGEATLQRAQISAPRLISVA